MSPPARTPSRRPRALIFTLVFVVVVAFGALAGVLAGGWSPRLGLDLAGGFSVVYKPAHKTSQANLNETVTILTNRVNGLGVSGATVNTQGDQIVVAVPDVKDPNAGAPRRRADRTAALPADAVLRAAVFASHPDQGRQEGHLQPRSATVDVPIAVLARHLERVELGQRRELQRRR